MSAGEQPTYRKSPNWSQGTKGFVTAGLMIVLALALYLLRAFVLPLIFSFVVAYVLEPVVAWLHRRTRLSRTLTLIVVYVLIIAGLVAIPVTTIPRIVEQLTNLFSNLPRFIQQAAGFLSSPIQVLDFTFTPLEQFPIDQLTNSLVGVIQTAGTQSVTLLGRLTSATVATLGWVAFVLFVSFYAIKDDRDLYDGAIRLLPEIYRDDLRRLGRRADIVWNAFLRGQVVLSLTVAIVTLIAATAIGLPNALVLALTAGLLEVVPYLGPILAAIPAMLLAFFQPDASWLGALIGPYWYTLTVALIYWLIQQLENYLLLPRIMGRQLKMHPIVVFLAAIGAASFAGILGVFLASPILATLRILGRYVYCKLTDTDPFADDELHDPILDALDAARNDIEQSSDIDDLLPQSPETPSQEPI